MAKKTSHFQFILPGVRGIHTNLKQKYFFKSQNPNCQSTKRGFSKKALTGFEKLFLFWVRMNPSNAWKDKLEVASFFCHLNPCTGSVLRLHYLSVFACQRHQLAQQSCRLRCHSFTSETRPNGQTLK